MAKLYFRYGAMNSGKTTALIQVAFNYEERGMRVLLIKPSVDTKGDDLLVSRIGATRRVDILAHPGDDLYAVIEKDMQRAPLHCVLADEAQFFTPEQVDQLFRAAVKLRVPVICYGLRTDFRMNGFPGSIRLLELAHSIEELKTICACGKKAVLNGRMINGKFVFEGSQVCIENMQDVVYQSLCPECYFRLREEYEKSGGKIKDN
ncbi:MAG: thymidine kinase [Oscillospiraceae bacterium]|nr:thymidine kinase [Oscillospiraceae bacterium]